VWTGGLTSRVIVTERVTLGCTVSVTWTSVLLTTRPASMMVHMSMSKCNPNFAELQLMYCVCLCFPLELTYIMNLCLSTIQTLLWYN